MGAMEVGTWVRWKSGAAGYVREKVGQIVEVVPRNHRPKTKGDFALGRSHESYVVWVSGRGHYWPRVKLLERLDGPPAD